MKKILYSMSVRNAVFATACDDYLELAHLQIARCRILSFLTATARAALDDAYEQWREMRRIRFFLMACFMLLILLGLIQNVILSLSLISWGAIILNIFIKTVHIQVVMD